MKEIKSNVNCLLLFFLAISTLFCCNNIPKEKSSPDFIMGADLSYVNELEDCGAQYKNSNGKIEDPFQIFKTNGANLIRVRKWHNPTWTNYSNFDDVKKTIKRAKALQMKVLLDFHYSDTWTDPEKQWIPKAWEAHIDDTKTLGDSLYNYTYTTLVKLHKENLLPNMVQVGNEINAMLLQKDELKWPIDWERNSYLINKGIQAVRDVSKKVNQPLEIVLHIAQPDNALWWFKEASQNGISDYDWIGLSYYPIWSEYDLQNVSKAFKTLIETYKKKLIVVETSYPFTMDNIDEAGNILDEKCLIEGYPPTEDGQYQYLLDLKQQIQMAGGLGLIYWEPAWISTRCKTLWAQGSHWDNATLFNHNNRPTKAMQIYNNH